MLRLYFLHFLHARRFPLRSQMLYAQDARPEYDEHPAQFHLNKIEEIALRRLRYRSIRFLKIVLSENNIVT
jgi:hypothetical protein